MGVVQILVIFEHTLLYVGPHANLGKPKDLLWRISYKKKIGFHMRPDSIQESKHVLVFVRHDKFNNMFCTTFFGCTDEHERTDPLIL